MKAPLYYHGKPFLVETTFSVGNIFFDIDAEDRLGFGGNGVVYSCYNRSNGDHLAMKVQLNLDGNRRERFKREVSLLKSLSHSQLMPLIATGDIPGQWSVGSPSIHCPYIIMPYAKSNLKKIVMAKRGDTFSYPEYIAQFKGLADALSVLHTRAIHRDIKPENILIKGETWILSDFGLCSFTAGAGRDITKKYESVGPIYWMSPEAMNRVLGNNDVISKCSDVFQLASVFWYVVTGRHPTGIVTEKDWNGPHSVFVVLADALSHDIKRRPQDGAAFAKRLNATAFV